MTNEYRCLSKQIFEQEEYSLVPLRDEDKEFIRQWRNKQIDILRQTTPITPDEQELYFKKSITPLFQQEQPEQILFSILHQGTFIGYGGLTHVRWDSKCGEISFLLKPDDKNITHIFSIFLKMMCQVAFDELHFNKIITETYSSRSDIIATLIKFGFQFEGRLRQHVYKDGKWLDSLCHAYFAPQHLGDRLPGILITSISKKVPLIKAVRNAVLRCNDYGWIHGCDSNDLVVGKHFVDRFWHCPKLDKLKLETLLAYCIEQRIAAIIPTRDEELIFFSKHKQALHDQGIRVMISPLNSIEVCEDKILFCETLAHLPVIPTTLSPKHERVVVKERFGAGSHRAALNLSKDEAQEIAKTLESPIFQPYIEGTEYTVDCYITDRGALHGALVRSRDLVLNGESQITTTLHHEEIEKLARSFVESLRFEGHILIQVIEDQDRTLHLVECNPRFGGASTASIAAGLDSFYWFLSGNTIPFHPTINLKQIRYPQDLEMTHD